MKNKIILLVSLAGLALVSGCTGLASVTHELALDPAIVSGQLNTVYGTLHFARVGAMGTNQSVTISPDGTITVNKTP